MPSMPLEGCAAGQVMLLLRYGVGTDEFPLLHRLA